MTWCTALTISVHAEGSRSTGLCNLQMLPPAVSQDAVRPAQPPGTALSTLGSTVGICALARSAAGWGSPQSTTAVCQGCSGLKDLRHASRSPSSVATEDQIQNSLASLAMARWLSSCVSDIAHQCTISEIYSMVHGGPQLWPVQLL